jgi:mannitol-specific phosphotransferase system IIBC component
VEKLNKMMHEDTVYNLRGALFGTISTSLAPAILNIHWENVSTAVVVAIVGSITGYFTTKFVRWFDKKITRK